MTGDVSARALEEWTDEELVVEYRYLKGDLADREPGQGQRQVSSEAIEQEMRRRGLEPDREDIIPEAEIPDRGQRWPRSRGTAPDAGEDTPG
jgi:hypothetical protein